MGDLIALPPSLPGFLSPYLPPPQSIHPNRPFVTLTWAQSLDLRILAGPGQRTVISHLETKTMTHYLRSKHQAILVGANTAVVDDPKLSCRYFGEGDPQVSQIIPVVVDPHGRWDYDKSHLRTIVDEGKGRPPIIIHGPTVPVTNSVLESQGGQRVKLTQLGADWRANWEAILSTLKLVGIESVMVEGGAAVINSLLPEPDLVDSVVITVGPVFLGTSGTLVSPPTGVSMTDVTWWAHGTLDTVLAARLR